MLKARASVPQSGASTSTLARMASLALGTAKKAEDENDKKDVKSESDDEDKEDDKKDAKSEDKKDDEGAEDGGDDEDMSEDEDENDKAEKDGDDESDEDDKADKKARAARRRERGRIASIITSKAAQRSSSHYAMAVNLALNTQMNRGEAIALLGGMPDVPAAAEPPKPASQAARERLNGAPNPDVGSGDGGDGKGPNLAAQIVAAGKKRRGEA
ncbi:hypothetical protein [Bradyrhizobium japonicum]|uniref:hypothetical protein n=1 Tax=Bradyrhizobium japonicum TaxID=375 RepID=UPI000414EBFB|nr:hypothetical protein [Bradyrhizobium japonicum]